MNGLTSPGTGVIEVGFRPDKFFPGPQGIALPGQNDPDILGSEQVVNNPGTGWLCKSTCNIPAINSGFAVVM